MKNLKEFLLACFILVGITSCFVANEPPTDSVESNTTTEEVKIQWGAEIASKPEAQCVDQEVAIEPAHQACSEGDSCVVVERGCCPGEKRVAVNWKSLAIVKKKLREGCTTLMAAQAKENNHNICRNRRQLGAFFKESPRCVKGKCVINDSECLEVKCIASDRSCCSKKECVKDETAGQQKT